MPEEFVRPDEVTERYGQPRDRFNIVVSKHEYNTYVSVEERHNNEFKLVPGTAVGVGDRPYAQLVHNLMKKYGIPIRR